MANKNIIYIIGGMALIGIFIYYYVYKKPSTSTQPSQSVTHIGNYTVPISQANKGWISYTGKKYAIITDIMGNQFSVFKFNIKGQTLYSLMENTGINEDVPYTPSEYDLYPSIQDLANNSNIIIKNVKIL